MTARRHCSHLAVLRDWRSRDGMAAPNFSRLKCKVICIMSDLHGAPSSFFFFFNPCVIKYTCFQMKHVSSVGLTRLQAVTAPTACQHNATQHLWELQKSPLLSQGMAQNHCRARAAPHSTARGQDLQMVVGPHVAMAEGAGGPLFLQCPSQSLRVLWCTAHEITEVWGSEGCCVSVAG